MERTNERSNRTPQEPLNSGSALKILKQIMTRLLWTDILKEGIKTSSQHVAVEKILRCDNSLGLRKQDVHFKREKKQKHKERGRLFHSSHNGIQIKQSQSQLITGVACRGKHKPRHETGSVEQYPALKETNNATLPFVFAQRVPATFLV